MNPQVPKFKEYGSVEDQKFDLEETGLAISEMNDNNAYNISMMMLAVFVITLGYTTMLSLRTNAPLFQAGRTGHKNSKLSFAAHVEHYGTHSTNMLKSYGYDMILEPHRNLVLKPLNGRQGSAYKWTLTELANWQFTEDTVLVEDYESDELSLTITSTPPRKYTLEMVETDEDGIVTSVTSSSVVSKYVRREFRDLSDSETSSYFSALEELYRLDTETGQATYGSDFKNYEYFAAKHNSLDWCFHGGMQYLTTHAGFTLDLDKALRTINATLVTPYWDFTIEAANYGAGEWYQSNMFSDSRFGPVKTTAEDSYLITTGLFTEIPIVYGDTSEENLAFHFNTNSFGANTDGGNQVYDDYIMRSTDFCGWTGTQPLPTCSDMMSCFDDYGSVLPDWEICIEKNVHANFHSINAGSQGCIDDWSEVLEENPTWESVLAFLGPSTTNIWYEYGTEYNWFTCPTSCSKDSDDAVSCTCTSNYDVASMTDDEIYSTLETFLGIMYDSFYMGDEVLEYSAGVYKWSGFSDEESSTINRFLFRHATNPGTAGQVATGAGPNDPLFFAFHPFFDRMYTGYRLSSSFLSGKVLVGWSTNMKNCTGGDEGDNIPFESLFPSYDSEFGVSGYYTNSQFNEALDPQNDYIDYVFDSFDSWGNCTFDLLSY